MSQDQDAHVRAQHADTFETVHYAVYDPQTGLITQSGNMAPWHLRKMQKDHGWTYVLTGDLTHPRTHKINLASLKPEPYTPPPPVKSVEQQRREEYPPLEELADALYWQSQGDNSKLAAYLEKIGRVKAKLPK